mmetsp:Transcript_3782/g.7575  ORF Transcript_3782/g.7575 Transcript_3782/m.7575 type:complete len:576 (-) Transcript_3782:1950-3677(-)
MDVITVSTRHLIIAMSYSFAQLVTSKSLHFIGKGDRRAASGIHLLTTIHNIPILHVIHIVLVTGQHVPNGLFQLHSHQDDHEKQTHHSPHDAIDSVLPKDHFVQSRSVGNDHLQDGHNGIRIPSQGIAAEGTGVKGGFAREAGAHGNGTGPKRQYIQGQGPNLCTIVGSFEFRVVINAQSPEGCPHRRDGQQERTPGNAKEQEATNQALADTTRWNVHNTIFRRFNRTDKSKGTSTNQVTVQDLYGHQHTSTGATLLILAVVKAHVVKAIVGVAAATRISKGQTKQDRKALRIVNGSVHQQHLAQIIPHHTAFAHGRHNRRKVIVRQDHIRRLSSHFSPFLAHGHTHIGSFQSRCIIDTIARHTRDFTFGLQGLDNPDFVLRRGTRKHIILLGRHAEFIVAHAIHFRTGNRLRVDLVDQTQHAANGQGGITMIAGNHGHADTRSMGFLDGLNAFGTRRVHNGTESHHGQPRFAALEDKFRSKLIALFDFTLLNSATRQGQDTETMRREYGDFFNPLLLVAGFQIGFAEASTLGLVFAQFNHFIGSTLDVDHKFVHVVVGIIFGFWFMHRGHEFVF